MGKVDLRYNNLALSQPMITLEEDKKFKRHALWYAGVLLFFILGILLFVPVAWFNLVGLVILSLLLGALFFVNLNYGLYALSAFGLFHGLEIVFGNYAFTRNVAYLSAINAPLVDFIAIALGGCAFLAVIFKFFPVRWASLGYLWKIIPFGVLFLAVSVFSAVHAYDHRVLASLKYLLRPIVFCPAFFIILPNILVKNRIVFLRMLQIWFVVGVLSALFGLSSLFIVSSSSFLEATPYTLFGFAPLGNNHNLLAEVLTVTLPIALYLTYEAKIKTPHKKIWYVYGLGSLIILVINFLTLSRAAWLAMAFEGMVAVYFLRTQLSRWWQMRKAILVAPIVALLLLIGVYMTMFLFTYRVSSSNNTRLQMTEITWFYFKRSPWIGYGPGMYVNLLSDTEDFIVEHGAALDSHGLVQKIALEEGVLGLVTFSIFLGSIFYFLFSSEHSRVSQKHLLQSLCIMSVGIVFFELFNTSYFNSIMWMPLGLAILAAGKKLK